MASSAFVSALADSKYAAAIKLLDGEILAAKEAGSAAGSEALAELHYNRGACHQRLQLYRKALKVGGKLIAGAHARCLGRAPAAEALRSSKMIDCTSFVNTMCVPGL